eukprot:Rmarinus@m.22459
MAGHCKGAITPLATPSTSSGSNVVFNAFVRGSVIEVRLGNGYYQPLRLSFDMYGDLWMIMDNGHVLVHHLESNKLEYMFSVGRISEPFGFACFDHGPSVVVSTVTEEYRFNISNKALGVHRLGRPLIGAKLIFPLPREGALAVPNLRDHVVQSSNAGVNQETEFSHMIDHLCVTPDGNCVVTCDRKGVGVSVRDRGYGNNIECYDKYVHSLNPNFTESKWTIDVVPFTNHSGMSTHDFTKSSVICFGCNNSKLFAVHDIGALVDARITTRRNPISHATIMQSFDLGSSAKTIAVSSTNMIAYTTRHTLGYFVTS